MLRRRQALLLYVLRFISAINCGQEKRRKQNRKERIRKITAVLCTSNQRLQLSANWRTPRFDMNPCLKLFLKRHEKHRTGNKLRYAGYEVLTAVFTQLQVFCDTMPCPMVHSYQCFVRACCLRHLDQRLRQHANTYTPVTIYQSIWRHNPQGLNLHIAFFKQPYLMISAPGAYYWTISMEIHKTDTHVCTCIVTEGNCAY